MSNTRLLRGILVIVIAGLTITNAAEKPGVPSKIMVYSKEKGGFITVDRVEKTDAEWRKQLSAEQYRITRKKGTERAFTGEYHNMKEKGVYQCVCCGNDLFTSEAKYDSGTGWPSYYEPVHEKNIKTADDHSLFMTRTEVLCSRCDAHLGHVFDDGPEPTYLRYCINSLSLKFKKM